MFKAIKKIFGNATNYKQLVQDGAIIVDVRTGPEFLSGHINGAINIPLDFITTRIAELKKSNRPIITCCRSGARSGMARAALSAAGLQAYNGGAWDSLDKKINW